MNLTRAYTRVCHAALIQYLQSLNWKATGLDDLADLIKKYSKEPSSYSPDEMRACLDGFRDVLFSHLDEEVSFHTLLTFPI